VVILLARAIAVVGLGLVLIAVELTQARRLVRAQPWALATDQIMILGAGMALGAGMTGSLVFGSGPPGPDWLTLAAGLAVGATALLIRVLAIRSLGRHYTLTPTVADEQELVTGGPYRLVRHPGYAAILLSILGFELLNGSWIAVACTLFMVVPTALRILVEERMLLDHFGDRYRRYQARTPHRLIPGLY
jgi:protein-S-isoprenylcysteine O-methyltransferase Ste14